MDGVPGDENVPLLDHITEFRSRLIIVVFALGISAAVAYPFSGTLIHYIWNDLLPEGTRMVVCILSKSEGKAYAGFNLPKYRVMVCFIS